MNWLRGFFLLLLACLAYAAIPDEDYPRNDTYLTKGDNVADEENKPESQTDEYLSLFVGGNARQECVVSCPSCPVCSNLSCPKRIPPRYSRYRGNRYDGYYRFHTIPQTWHKAQEICAQDGGHLVVLNSKEEADLVVRLNAQRGSYLHIGMHDWIKQGTYTTIFGETLQAAGFSNWDVGQPQSKNDRCGCIRASTGRLHDIYCLTTALFVCEIPF